jgi:hypothetical protein
MAAERHGPAVGLRDTAHPSNDDITITKRIASPSAQYPEG